MSKQSRKEGNNVAMAIKASKTEYYVSDVALEDSEADAVAASESVRKTLGKFAASYMLITAGVEKLIVIINIHNQQAENISAKEWLQSSIIGIGKDTDISEDSTDTFAKAVITIDTPFKLKDSVRGNAFAFLRKKKLLVEESDEEEDYGFEI
jgi:hypothetical protein